MYVPYMRIQRRKLAPLVRLAAVLGVFACAGGSDQTETEPDSTPAVTAEQPVAAVADTGCPKTGDWQLCSVEDRLTRAGLVVEKLPDPAERDLFSIPGIRFKLGARDDEVEVFVYQSAEARKGDTDKLDSIRVAPKGESRSYRVQPLLVTSANLAALIFTMNERTSERVSLALSAGLPQR